MSDATRTTKCETPDGKLTQLIDDMEQAMYDRRVDISHDGWTGGGTTFSVTVCSASPGAPVAMTMRVVANSEALAVVRTKTLMDHLDEGAELLTNASFTRSGESCRVYPDSRLLRAPLICQAEGPAGPWPPRPARLSPLEMHLECLMRSGALETERAATVSRVMSGVAKHPDRIDPADRDPGDRSTYNVEVCSMRAGVPVGVNVRVVAADKTEARARAEQLVRRLSQGTELIEGEDFTRPGESCRVFTDPACMPARMPIVDEGGGGW